MCMYRITVVLRWTPEFGFSHCPTRAPVVSARSIAETCSPCIDLELTEAVRTANVERGWLKLGS